MPNSLLLAPALALLLGAAEPGALERCAGIAADAERLACYDALARGAAAEAAAPAAPATDPVAEFGKPAKPTEAPELKARVVGMPREWAGGTRFELDNGQVWKAASGESGYYPAVPAIAEVTIRKSFFGAYWMEVHAIGRKIKVQRVS